jgi:hypothetical protein
MPSPVVRVSNIESQDGQKSLEQLQNTINSAKVEKTEDNGNIQYSNESLDNLVFPLLRSLKLQVRRHAMSSSTTDIFGST